MPEAAVELSEPDGLAFSYELEVRVERGNHVGRERLDNASRVVLRVGRRQKAAEGSIGRKDEASVDFIHSRDRYL